MAKKEDKGQKKEKGKRRGRMFSVSREAKRRLIPPFVMLTAGAVTSILMVVKGCSLNQFLARLLAILLVFYILGCVLKGMLDLIDKENRPPEPEESEEEMVEKSPEEENGGEGSDEKEGAGETAAEE